MLVVNLQLLLPDYGQHPQVGSVAVLLRQPLLVADLRQPLLVADLRQHLLGTDAVPVPIRLAYCLETRVGAVLLGAVAVPLLGSVAVPLQILHPEDGTKVQVAAVLTQPLLVGFLRQPLLAAVLLSPAPVLLSDWILWFRQTVLQRKCDTPIP
jgi:hypothetical protein